MKKNSFCDMKDCSYRYSHCRDAHHCGNCGKRGHCLSECSDNESKNNDPRSIYSRWEMDNQSLVSDNYDEVDTGAETEEIEEFEPPRKKNKTGKDEKDDTDDSKLYLIKCPKCRKYNKFSVTNKIFVDASCTICFSNNAEILFPQCSHLCTCLKCCDKLNENGKNLTFDFNLGRGRSNIVSFPIRNQSSSSSSSLHEGGVRGDSFTDRAMRTMGDITGKIYTVIGAGMGSSVYFRRNSPESQIERLFMNSDDWGQYGSGRVNEYNNFISGYRKI